MPWRYLIALLIVIPSFNFILPMCLPAFVVFVISLIFRSHLLQDIWAHFAEEFLISVIIVEVLKCHKTS
jgi:hypothetical protein